MNVVDEQRIEKSFDNDQLRQLFTFNSDSESTTYKPVDNQFEVLLPRILLPD